MSAQRKKLVELVENLPDDLEQEVTDFILFLLEKHVPKSQALDLDWKSGLREFREEFTSVDLQHKVLEKQAPTESAIEASGDFAELIEMADKHNFSSGRSDISSGAGKW